MDDLPDEILSHLLAFLSYDQIVVGQVELVFETVLSTRLERKNPSRII